MKLLFTKTILVLLLGTIPFVSFTQTIELGATESFALFNADGAFNNTGEATTVTGDVGTHVGAFNAFPPGVLIGQIHVADPVSAQAATDVDVLYSYLDGLTCGSVIGSTLGNGQILLPGIYCITEAASLNGDLILDAQCDADAIFIIQIDGALSTSTLANVILTNSASVCNIYWQINGAFNLGEGSVFRGNVVNNGAINLLEGSSLFGRGLSRSGAINLNTNVVNNNMLPVPLIITTTEPTSFCISGSVVLSGNCGGIWSNGASTPEITVSTAGDYFVTIDNGCGMAESNHILVTTFLLPVCSISVSNALCFGQTTDLCVAAGLSGYVWSNGTTNNCLTISAAGTYTVTISDVNGCTSSCSQTVTMNPLPACSITGSNVICTGQSTSLCVTAVAFSFVWSNGTTNNCVTISNAGTYTVTITDANGCTSSCSQTVTVNPLPACSISGSNVICTGQSTSLCVTAGAFSFVWSNGTTNNCVTISNAGTYTVTITDANGCTSSCSQTVTVNPLPACSISGSNVICTGQSTSLCVTAGAFSFVWSNGTTNNCVTISNAGTYTVTITDSNGCTSSCSQTVTVNPLPVCSISGSNVICNGQSTVLCVAAGASGYIWSNGTTNNCVTISSVGTYTVTITDLNGCTSSCSQTVTDSPSSTCSISGSNVICNGQSTVLCVPAGSSGYIWSNGATNNCVNISSAGSYTVTITYQNGCTSSCSQTVTENSLPACSISGSNVICNGQSTVLCVPAGASGYIWSNGATNNCVNISSAGTYTVTITDQNGCTSSCSLTVTETPLPPCTINGSNVICNGQSTILCVPAGSSGYIWSNGATNNCVNISSAGTYTITITYQNGCTSSCSQTVTENPLPACSISGSNVICNGQSTVLCVPAGSSGYIWSNGATNNCVNISSAGTYTVTITYQNGCTSSCSQTVTENPLPACSISGSNVICNGQSTVLCVPTGAISYLWSNGATTNCIVVNSPGSFTVTVTYVGGCISVCSQLVTVSPVPVCTISGMDIICEGQSTVLCVDQRASSYLWSTGDNSRCITISSGGTYFVTVTSADGCTSVCSHNVTVNPVPACSITGPESFCVGEFAQICASSGASSYVWSNGASTSCIIVNFEGTYRVTITATNGCTASCSHTLAVNSIPECSITGINYFCEGQSSELCATPGGQAYLWNNGATTSCITINASGNYIVTITAANGCTSSCEQNVTVYPLPACTIIGNNSLCDGQIMEMCTDFAVSYIWSNGETGRCITISEPGTYSVTTTNIRGCLTSCSKTITLNPLPSCNIIGFDTFCGGGSSEICSANDASAYMWSTGETARCITVSQSGNYIITITDENGCTSSCNKTIVVHPVPVCTIEGNNSFCIGESTYICVSDEFSAYLWNTGATTNCIFVTEAGFYQVTVTDSYGCTSVCNETIIIHPLPNCTIEGNESFCEGSATELCVYEGFNDYWWLNSQTTPCITVTEAGLYAITVTDINGCVSTCSKFITIDSASVCLITGKDSICLGDSTTLCLPPGLSEYWWSTGESTNCITVSKAGLYAITLTFDNGCRGYCSKYISVIPRSFGLISGLDSICLGDSISLCLPDGMSGTWGNGETSHCLTVTEAGLYAVSAIDTFGCTYDFLKNVAVDADSYNNVISASGSTELCKGEIVTLTGNQDGVWNTGSRSKSIQVTISGDYYTTKQTDCGVLESNHIRVNVIQDLIATVIIAEGVTSFCQGGFVVLSGNKGGKWNTGEETNSIAVKASGWYYVVNTNECEIDTSNTILVNVYPLPACRIDGKDTFCEGQSTQLCATSGMDYFWNTEETSSCIDVNKEATYLISISDSNGCISTCSKKVSEILSPSCLITGDLNPKAGKITALCVRDEMSSYLWDTKETSICIYVLSSGTKKVNIMNPSGCLDSCSVSVIFEEGTSDVEDERMQSDKTYSYKIYPNPFNEKITIDFQSFRSTPHFIIELFDVNGFKISTLYNESAIGGVLYSKEFYLENLSSGMYLVKLTDLGRITFKRMILIR